MFRYCIITCSFLSALSAAAAQTPDSKRDGQQTCEARADALHITGGMRDTYMRECLAGERLSEPKPPAK